MFTNRQISNSTHPSGKVHNARKPFISDEALTSPNRTKMNASTFNTSLSSCSFSTAFSPNPAKISPDLRAVFIVRIAVHALTCPLIILLNILVIVAVTTEPQLRTKPNTALACLATTDLVVGLVLQPLHIAKASFLLKGEHNMFCILTDLSRTVTLKCVLVSSHHLVLLSAERYVAIKHPFTYETKVTKARIIIASGLAWATAIILSSENLLRATRLSKTILILFETLLVMFSTSFKEVRRNEKQIAANQVSLKAKKKILKNKKAFYTIAIITLVALLCFILVNICLVILFSFKNIISPNVRHIAFYIFTLLPVLNSLFNPLIYAVRIRNFRVTFIQLVSRKATAQDEELERKIFGPKQIGVERHC